MSQNRVRKFDLGDLETKSPFYGREEELEDLKDYISNGCRLIALLGMEGIGKTSLAVKLAQSIKGDFDYVIGRSLKDFSSLDELLGFLLQVFSDQPATDQSNSVDIKIARLKEHCRKHRCLLLLADSEAIVQNINSAKQSPNLYQDYEKLFNAFAFGGVHRSCLILTSQCEISSIKKLQRKLGKKVELLHIKGMHKSAAKKILIAKGLTDSEPQLNKLIDYYQGNPYMLNMAASLIQRLCNGNVDQFFNDCTLVFDDIRQLLDSHFQRLSILEKEIMFCLANSEQSITIHHLRNKINKPGITSALDSLIRWSLVETISKSQEVSYCLKPIVIEFFKGKNQH